MSNKLLFIEANTSGTGILALQKAAALDLHPIFLTNNPRRYTGLTEADCAVVVCDTSSLAALQQAIEEHFSPREICGIMTTSDFYLETAASLATRYGLPGNAPDALHRARNKMLTRQILAEAGLPQPRFAVVRTVAQVAAVFRNFSLPCIVKPADDSGSNNVLLCQDEEQVQQQVAKILATRLNVRGQPTAGVALIEEYLDAPEYSVEIFAWQGQMSCIGITQKSLTGFPYFVESRHLFPATMPDEESRKIVATVQRALKLLELEHGATHTEVKWKPPHCFIIEINARLAGGMIPELIHRVTGTDLLEQQIRSAVRGPVFQPRKSQGVAGIQFLLAHKAGILRELAGLERAANLADVVEVQAIVKPGSFVQPPQNAYHRLGYVIVHSPDTDSAAARLAEAMSQIQLSID